MLFRRCGDGLCAWLVNQANITSNAKVNVNAYATRLARHQVRRCVVRSFAESYAAPPRPRRVTVPDLSRKKRKKQKITCMTAYDYPSALHVDRAGIDVLLVGDSCAMVELGYPTTQPMTSEEMLHHCRAVRRAVPYGSPYGPLVVADLVFGSYEISEKQAVREAHRLVKEAGVDAVKLEGARPLTIKSIVEGGVACVGHIGLTPQTISVTGGFRAQGRTAVRARQLLDEALALQEAGACALVLECMPAEVAAAVTSTLEIPTIGIGAGNGTDGQVLVYHDLLGMSSHPHHEQFVPRFCKRYARVGDLIQESLENFRKEVQAGTFPSEEYSPYKMDDTEREAFEKLLEEDGKERALQKQQKGHEMRSSDEYEVIGLYNDSSIPTTNLDK